MSQSKDIQEQNICQSKKKEYKDISNNVITPEVHWTFETNCGCFSPQCDAFV